VLHSLVAFANRTRSWLPESVAEIAADRVAQVAAADEGRA
jgi:hypothetical protein